MKAAQYLIRIEVLAGGHVIDDLRLGIIGPDYLSHRVAHIAGESLGCERSEANAYGEHAARKVEAGERRISVPMAEDVDAAVIVRSLPIDGGSLTWRLEHETADAANPGECGFCGEEIQPGEQYGLGVEGNAHANGHGCRKGETIPHTLSPKRQRVAAERE
jgi:hypothetical protein